MEHELGAIERKLYIDATPEVVFAVVSEPEHVRRWWPDQAAYGVEPGGDGRVGFAESDGGTTWERFTVVEVDPPRRLSFRWTHADGEAAARGNSFLVVLDLEPQGAGTRLSMSETGFRERGWAEAKVSAAYTDHVTGWDHFLARLPRYAESLGARA